MSTARYTLAWPPTVNTYWRTYRGRMLISQRGRAYRGHVAFIVRDQHRVDPDAWTPQPGQRLHLHIDAYPPDNRKRDLDNLPKAILDGLAHAHVYEDDNLIDLLVVKRHPADPKNPRVVITIEPLT